jgi:hypothetical protein
MNNAGEVLVLGGRLLDVTGEEARPLGLRLLLVCAATSMQRYWFRLGRQCL